MRVLVADRASARGLVPPKPTGSRRLQSTPCATSAFATRSARASEAVCSSAPFPPTCPSMRMVVIDVLSARSAATEAIPGAEAAVRPSPENSSGTEGTIEKLGPRVAGAVGAWGVAPAVAVGAWVATGFAGTAAVSSRPSAVPAGRATDSASCCGPPAGKYKRGNEATHSQKLLHQPPSSSSTYSPSARSSKRVYCFSKRTFAVPVGPFRCLARINSARF